MTAFVDTNVLIRHLTGEPPDQATRATEFLASGRDLRVVDLVVAEVVYVLESVYEVERTRIAQIIRSLASSRVVVVGDPGRLLRAAEVYELARIDFAEAYLVACAEPTGADVASFDRAIDRVSSVARVEP